MSQWKVIQESEGSQGKIEICQVGIIWVISGRCEGLCIHHKIFSTSDILWKLIGVAFICERNQNNTNARKDILAHVNNINSIFNPHSNLGMFCPIWSTCFFTLFTKYFFTLSSSSHLSSNFSVFRFEGNSVGCNLPVDFIQIAQYLKMFSIHSCQCWICSQNFHGQPYYLPLKNCTECRLCFHGAPESLIFGCKVQTKKF